jgi:translation initiation factor 1
MKDAKLVWSDEQGDLRKKKNVSQSVEVDEAALQLSLRRLTSGKGRTIIEIGGLPQNKKWCQKLAKNLKKKLGVGGAYKNNIIEIHGEKLDQVISFLEENALQFKKTGG